LAPATLLGAACSPAAILNAVAADRLYRDGIPYGPDPRQSLDLYRPVGIAPFPVAVFLYGGGWTSGNRALYRFVGGALANAGYLTVIPDYRLYPQVRYRGCLADCAAALAWTRREIAGFGGGPAPPALIGHSAGAYNAAMLTLDDGLLAPHGLSPRADIGRFVGLAGPYDFLPLDTDQLRAIFGPGPAGPDTQPITYADGGNPPMLLLAGTADTTVRPANTQRLAARVAARGGSVESRLYPGINHVEIVGAIGAPLRFLAPTLRDTLDFLRA
jgi:acetyl esterase/lipase